MAKKKQNKVSADLLIRVRKPEEAYPIPISEWNRIKDLAKQIKAPNRWRGYLGSVFIGVFGSAFIALICNISQNEDYVWYNDFMFVITIVSFVIAIALLFLDKEHNKSVEDIGKRIVSDMTYLEEKYPPIVEDTETRQKELEIDKNKKIYTRYL